jgi:hypothetical protein
MTIKTSDLKFLRVTRGFVFCAGGGEAAQGARGAGDGSPPPGEGRLVPLPQCQVQGIRITSDPRLFVCRIWIRSLFH